MVYRAGYHFDKPLAGLLVLSSYFVANDNMVIHQANKNTPLLIQHGNLDTVVPPVLGERAVQMVQSFGGNATYETYGMEHTLCSDQIQSISRWLQKLLT